MQIRSSIRLVQSAERFGRPIRHSLLQEARWLARTGDAEEKSTRSRGSSIWHVRRDLAVASSAASMELGQMDSTIVVSGEARDTLDHPRGRLST